MGLGNWESREDKKVKGEAIGREVEKGEEEEEKWKKDNGHFPFG